MSDKLYVEDRLVNMEFHLRDISSNANGTRIVLDDIRSILKHLVEDNYKRECSSALRESGCNHIIGYIKEYMGSGGLVRKGEDARNVKQFSYCPTCGMKLN